ncbi:hypothetical protein MED121_18520 [Marinomonas sp. MED121]|uniref:DUF4194 domain-containing protein n=1 Tax=Marinomonas sp. MED121 TaxID=314277 RepID=UPI0000690D74|nr:DUF4194 domain-containing protein [Marinomonas sp. MED121]EAQ65263.1 hypothetical protein MED121_18520 [Marinomonas sp. MED121]
MFNEVRNLINNTAVEESQIIETFNYLQNHQFVFRKRSKDRKHYAFISEHFDLFRSGFELFGKFLIQNNDYGYIGINSTSSDDFNRLTMIDTAILVTLRVIYHQEKESRSNEDGSISISGSHLVTQYKQYTERNDLVDSKSRFMEYLKLFKQKRILSLSSEVDEETLLPIITIFPTIEVIMTPEVALRLNQEIANRANSASSDDDTSQIKISSYTMEEEV